MINRNLLVRMACVFSLALCLTVRAEEENGEEKPKDVSPEAKKILEQSVEAVKKVNFARYNGEYTGTTWIRQYVADVKGKAVIGEPSENDVPRFRCDVEMTPPAKPDSEEKPETKRFTAGSDGDEYYLIDPKEKTAYVDMDPAVLGSGGRDIQRLIMRELVAKEPFADELKSDTIQKKEDFKVGSEMCHQISVKTERGEVNWFIAKSDLLPRRVERLYKNEKDEVGTTDFTITDLKYSSKLDPADFAVKVPDGFKKTDEFAP